jgi:hypothetical protein
VNIDIAIKIKEDIDKALIGLKPVDKLEILDELIDVLKEETEKLMDTKALEKKYRKDKPGKSFRIGI